MAEGYHSQSFASKLDALCARSAGFGLAAFLEDQRLNRYQLNIPVSHDAPGAPLKLQVRRTSLRVTTGAIRSGAVRHGCGWRGRPEVLLWATRQLGVLPSLDHRWEWSTTNHSTTWGTKHQPSVNNQPLSTIVQQYHVSTINHHRPSLVVSWLWKKHI